MDKQFVTEKLAELEKKDGFIDALKKASTKEETVNVLADFGWNLTIDQFNNEVLPALSEYVDNKDGELEASDLDKVSGGLGLIGSLALIGVGIWVAKGFFKGMGC